MCTWWRTELEMSAQGLTPAAQKINLNSSTSQTVSRAEENKKKKRGGERRAGPGWREGGWHAYGMWQRKRERERGGGGAEGKVSSAATAVQHKDERNGEGVGRESERTNEKERRGAEFWGRLNRRHDHELITQPDVTLTILICCCCCCHHTLEHRR